ncbi:hypothetical protein, partial [Xanthomonas citri]|uniref:hypothetical protein n=2 Tax=Xanthomonas citri TaxID=346 RepID=UPI0024E0157F
SELDRHFCNTSLARMVGTLLWLNHLEACPMRAPSSTAWPTKRLISQEEMWGNLSIRFAFSMSLILRRVTKCNPPPA